MFLRLSSYFLLCCNVAKSPVKRTATFLKQSIYFLFQLCKMKQIHSLKIRPGPAGSVLEETVLYHLMLKISLR